MFRVQVLCGRRVYGRGIYSLSVYVYQRVAKELEHTELSSLLGLTILYSVVLFATKTR